MNSIFEKNGGTYILGADGMLYQKRKPQRMIMNLLTKQKRPSKPSWTASEGCTGSGITMDGKMIPILIPDHEATMTKQKTDDRMKRPTMKNHP